MRFLVALVTIATAAVFAASADAAEFDKYGFESVGATLTTSQAGGHPESTVSFEMKTNSVGFPFAATRDVEVRLPPGLVGNLAAFPRCTILQFQSEGCPIDSQLGVVEISAYELGSFVEPLYYLTPGPDTVARVGFFAQIYPNVVNVRVRSESDYGVSASAEGVLSVFPVVSVTTTLWAVPADPSHDALRITPGEAANGEAPPGGGRSSGLPPTPFMVNPTRCGVSLDVGFTATSYQLPESPSSLSAALGSITGCGKLGFAPTLSATPSTHETEAPSGLDVDVNLPQNDSVGGLAPSHVREAKVSLPQGMTINPAAAADQEACSEEQAGYKSRHPATCPPASKLGTVEVDIPALERPLKGALYLRTPEAGNLFRVWLVADDLGLHLALPGQLDVDKATGRISSAFFDMPQAPVEEAKVHVFGGSRAPLATPSRCGIYGTDWQLTPWSGEPPVGGTASMAINESCDTGAFDPRLAAGAVTPVAGAFSTFLARLTREPGEQNVSSLAVSMPPGVSARLAGVTLCEGVQAESGDCPAGSRIGTASVAAGAGPNPLWLPQPNREPISIYLGGPYKDAPLSLVVNAPAQAGPFDLGDVVTRATVRVDPETAGVTVSSDPLPQILEGVPISYRTIDAEIDRPKFALNPTSCEPKAVATAVSSAQGALANPSSRFQVGDCQALPFKPGLSLRLLGKRTSRGGHPALRAVLRTRSGDANAQRVSVALPRSEFLDQGHIRTICTRVQFAADQCPQDAIYGHARVFTPLLDQPLEGPVYLRSSSHLLPDLVVALKGQIDIDAVGRIDSIRGGIRTTFETVPDAPVSKVVLTMQGGKKGLLINSRDVCKSLGRVAVHFTAHNGKRVNRNPVLKGDCAGRAH